MGHVISFHLKLESHLWKFAFILFLFWLSMVNFCQGAHSAIENILWIEIKTMLPIKLWYINPFVPVYRGFIPSAEWKSTYLTFSMYVNKFIILWPQVRYNISQDTVGIQFEMFLPLFNAIIIKCLWTSKSQRAEMAHIYVYIDLSRPYSTTVECNM